jgi:transcriptional regulator with XRE-family HTH domain
MRLMGPSEWRKHANLSQAAMAEKLGISGENPARTWGRWELGERVPPIDVIVAVERLSEGAVTASSWAEVRGAHLQTRRSSAPTIEARAS